MLSNCGYHFATLFGQKYVLENFHVYIQINSLKLFNMSQLQYIFIFFNNKPQFIHFSTEIGAFYFFVLANNTEMSILISVSLFLTLRVSLGGHLEMDC